jgi:hypothetical protein
MHKINKLQLKWNKIQISHLNIKQKQHPEQYSITTGRTQKYHRSKIGKIVISIVTTEYNHTVCNTGIPSEHKYSVIIFQVIIEKGLTMTIS